MTTFEIRPAKPWHCGQMSRLLRREHHEAALRVGLDSRRGLRDIYGQSYYRRAWFIDGDLAGLGGVKGSLLSPSGFVWVALSQKATRYPKAIIQEARRQLDFLMQTHRELHTTIIGGDEAAKRLVIHLGFHVTDHGEGAAGYTRYGRKRLADFIDREPAIRIPFGKSFAVFMGYHAEMGDG